MKTEKKSFRKRLKTLFLVTTKVNFYELHSLKIKLEVFQTKQRILISKQKETVSETLDVFLLNLKEFFWSKVYLSTIKLKINFIKLFRKGD